MPILGIESSCDETGAAVVSDDGVLLSNIVYSQIKDHRPYGGVVPEIASRKHLEKIGPVVESALEEAGLKLKELDAIAVTQGPGLVGCLLVGLSYAKALGVSHGLPVIGINHLEGHLLSPFLGDDPPSFPFITLLVSGGHTSLYLAEAFGRYRHLGSTRDDAAGEAFDKVGKLLGMSYPAGAEMDRVAQGGRVDAVPLPRPMIRQGGLDFSFSGMKTAVLNHVRAEGIPEGEGLRDLCASFQEAVADVIAWKIRRAVRDTGIKTIVVSGGVAANSHLRARMAQVGEKDALRFHFPPLSLCGDNGAMIALAGLYHFREGRVDGPHLTANPGISLATEGLS